MPCCSMGLAVSNIVHVDAPVQILWEVLTDIEGYPNFVETIQRTKVKLPDPSVAVALQSPSSKTTKTTTTGVDSTVVKSKRVQVGTQIYEVRGGMKKKTNKKVSFNLRRTVTNVIENPVTKEYSISFLTQLDDDHRKFGETFCNTSTLSIIPYKKEDIYNNGFGDKVVSDDIACKLIGSFAVELGGPTKFGCMICFPFIHCKNGMRRHAQMKFEEELRNYGKEAERRYELKSAAK